MSSEMEQAAAVPEETVSAVAQSDTVEPAGVEAPEEDAIASADAADDASREEEAAATDVDKYADGSEEISVGFANDAKKITLKSTFTDSKDGTKIRVLKYGSGAKRLLIVHGAAEWVGRYGYTINFFASQGYEVTFVELRGQGKSDGNRMDLKTWDHFVQDMQAAAATIEGDCVCLCHSNGGLTMAYATSVDQVPANIKKIVYSNPNIRNVKNGTVRLVSWIPFNFSASAGISVNELSDCPDANAHYEQDENVPKLLSADYVTAMVRAQDVVAKALGTKGKDIPCSFFLGSKDSIADHAKGKLWAEGQKRQLGDSECAIKVYDGQLHEMINGKSKDAILKDMAAWLDPSAPTDSE